MINNKLIEKWLTDNLITESQAQVMLSDIEVYRKQKGASKFLTVIAFLGACFIGVGVLWVLASGWDLIPDFAKVIFMTIVTLGVTYLGYYLAYIKATYPRTGVGLVFLGCILYGATIMLIGRIFNVNAGEPFLLLLWGVGVMPMAYYLRSSVMGLLGTSLLLAWIVLSLVSSMGIESGESGFFLMYFFKTIGVILFTFGSLHYYLPSHQRMSRAYRLVGILITVVVLLVLTFRWTHFIQVNTFINEELVLGKIFFLFGVSLFGIIVNYILNPSQSKMNKLENGVAGLILISLLVKTFMFGLEGWAIITYLFFNALFVGLVVTLLYVGYTQKDSKLSNIAWFGLYFYLITKFFDLFSGLMTNGLTWIGFGIVLIAGSIFLEKKRRQFQHQISNAKS